MIRLILNFFFFFFNDTATTEIYTLSLHDALPISRIWRHSGRVTRYRSHIPAAEGTDRKSTRLNSSHSQISYAVFCLKKKKITKNFERRSDQSPRLCHIMVVYMTLAFFRA